MLHCKNILAGAISLCVGLSASAAEPALKGYVIARPATQHFNAAQTTTTTGLPLWNYQVTAGSDLGGAVFKGSIVGANPASGISTTVPTQIVPLVITITDSHGTITYNPTRPDRTCGGTVSPLGLVKGSPIFTKVAWTSNGASVGTTQYIDAFNRAEFWSLAGGTGYHVLLKPIVLTAQNLSFASAQGANVNAKAYGGCGHLGLVDVNTMDGIVQGLIRNQLASVVNPGTFPIFITRDVVMTSGGNTISNCCILGYHGGYYVGSSLQIYSPFSYDTTGLFGGDVSTLAHEMGEAINDPTGGNPTPVWGNIGQVQSQCQNNFEVGDPLSPGWPGSPAASPVVAPNGVTYHVQDLAFFNWFFGGTSQGSGGKFSMFGNFAGNAKLCSAGGGTN